MISTILIFSRKGDVIFSRPFKDISPSITETLRVRLTHQKSLNTPILKIDDVTFAYMMAGNLWICAGCNGNPNVSLIFCFLTKLCVLFSDLKINTDAEAFFTQRFYIIQMIDEMIDFGMVQTTDFNTLNAVLAIPNQKSLASLFKTSVPHVNPANVTSQLTGQVSWRKGVIKYNENELALDVRETVNCLVSVQGSILSSSVDGTITLNSRLNGNPELRLGINDKSILEKNEEKKSQPRGKNGIEFDDFSFHQCVHLNNYDQTKNITFIPPDGSFQLLKYRTTNDVILPLKVLPMVKDLGSGKEEIKAVLTGNFERNVIAKRVVVTVRVSKNAFKVDSKSSKGRSKFDKSINSVVWKISKMNGGEDVEITIVVETPIKKSMDSKEAVIHMRPPISIDFSVPFSCSGLRVRYLKVLETKLNYNDSNVLKWIRYVSSGGTNYQYRI